jgi:hypothetical protein
VFCWPAADISDFGHPCLGLPIPQYRAKSSTNEHLVLHWQRITSGLPKITG